MLYKNNIIMSSVMILFWPLLHFSLIYKFFEEKKLIIFNLNGWRGAYIDFVSFMWRLTFYWVTNYENIVLWVCSGPYVMTAKESST